MRKNPESGKNIRMLMWPFLISLLPPKHDGWFVLAPHREMYNGIKTGFVGFHIDLFTRPLKMTSIILHSRQEGPIRRGLVAPEPTWLTRLSLFIYHSAFPNTSYKSALSIHVYTHINTKLCTQIFLATVTRFAHRPLSPNMLLMESLTVFSM